MLICCRKGAPEPSKCWIDMGPDNLWGSAIAVFTIGELSGAGGMPWSLHGFFQDQWDPIPCQLTLCAAVQGCCEAQVTLQWSMPQIWKKSIGWSSSGHLLRFSVELCWRSAVEQHTGGLTTSANEVGHYYFTSDNLSRDREMPWITLGFFQDQGAQKLEIMRCRFLRSIGENVSNQ